MDNLPVSFVDIVLIAVILVSAILAFMRGFVHEVLTLAAWIGAVVVTVFVFEPALPYVQQFIASETIANVATGLGLFVVSLIVFTIVSHALSRNVRTSALGAVDRSLGLLFGAARGAFLICAAYLAMMWAIPKPEDWPLWIQNARSAPMVERGAVYLASLLPAEILERGEDAVGNAAEAADEAETLIDAGEAVDSLSGTGSGTDEESSDSGTEPADSGAESDGAEPEGSGYNDAERNQMNQVIQSTE